MYTLYELYRWFWTGKTTQHRRPCFLSMTSYFSLMQLFHFFQHHDLTYLNSFIELVKFSWILCSILQWLQTQLYTHRLPTTNCAFNCNYLTLFMPSHLTLLTSISLFILSRKLVNRYFLFPTWIQLFKILHYSLC